MDNFMMNSFPDNIKKELEAIQKLIMPIAKKTSKYMIWTFPLIGISIFNIVYLLFFTPRDTGMYIYLAIYAVVGALGFALLKETRLYKKEIEQIGVKYIIERIKKSRLVSEERKHQYIQIVRQQPVKAMENFVKFLQEEDRIGRRFGNNDVKND
ncbi:YwnF family protein [Fervidibacillus halotolerans]|uniref:YwnF family protein n=1 Tax=Fervidibacillus halotolerans TaxID=2980027 RepID=A0A9E8RY72_9BACI|nr:YwnF family protein [Fervidibacillus halotolerans]WAA11924.1 YwnF family protein [Fervidibacillus halotolerans]